MSILFRLLALLALLLAATPAAQAQTTPAYTPAQTARLARLSALYGHVKFFHPYLGYKKLNWDSAYAANAPLIAAARTDAETADALRRLLAVLGDAATTVQLGPATGAATAAPARPAVAADSLRVFWGADSTLVLQTGLYAGADDYDLPARLLGGFVARLPRARAVLLDLRSPRPLTNDQKDGFAYALEQSRLARRLTSRPLDLPAQRLRGHSGFAPEVGNTSGGYYSYFYTKTNPPLAPADPAARARPVAVLLNENAPLPPELYALQALPQVRLFSTGPVSEAALAETTTFTFSATIEVKFRTGELLNPDGRPGVQGLTPVPPTVAPDAMPAYVLSQLRQPRPAAPAGGAAAAPPLSLPPPATYPPGAYPSLGYRLLAGAKIWSVIHYFHAYRELMPTPWDAALPPALAELAAAPDATAYALAVAHLYRHLQDGHAFINSQAIRDYVGAGGALVDVRFIENQPVITRLYGDSLRAKGLRVGDVLTAVNGEPVAARVARMAAIQPASNEWTRRRYVSNRLVRAPVGQPIRLALRGADGRPKTVVLRAQPASRLIPGPDTAAIFRVLPGNLGYVNLDRLESADTDKMLAALMNTRAIIFDMRGYPHGTAWTIAPRLTTRLRPVAGSFRRYTPSAPNGPGLAYSLTEQLTASQGIPANPGKPVYRGKTVMLIDERTQSQAEHTGLFFEAANGTEFIGSPTAGANGDVTSFAIPGGITLSFSGHDVRHADGRQLQQVGLQPKILVRPTLRGIQAGRDEVLERAVRYLSGPAPAAPARPVARRLVSGPAAR